MTPSEIPDELDILKHRLKKYNNLYGFLINIISPVYPSFSPQRIFSKYLTESNSIALNLGSGNSNVSDKILNVDIFEYENVNIVCDIENLPFIDNSIDIVFNIAVLEHVKEPEKVIDEIKRVLKKGGIVISFFPFIQPFHASPNDFSRRTKEGMKILYKDFNIIELNSAGGPTSGFLWIFQEWLALIFSFGIKKLHIILSLIFMILTFPLKFIDILLIKHPMASNISSGFLYIGRK
jgi:SAM-dependent methyltransferase